MDTLLFVLIAAFIGTALAELLLELVIKKHFFSEKKTAPQIASQLPVIDKILKKRGPKSKKAVVIK